MTDYEYITNLNETKLVYTQDRTRIFNLHFKYFNVYPQGKPSCGVCIAEALKQLTKTLTLQNLLNNE